MICKNCNQQIDDDSKFCVHCGSKIVINNKNDNIYKYLTIALSIIVVILIGIAFSNNSSNKNNKNTLVMNQNSNTKDSSSTTSPSVNSSPSSKPSLTSAPTNNPGQTSISSKNNETVNTANSASSVPKPTATEKPKKEEDLGFFKVEINGNEQTYTPKNEFTNFSGWEVTLVSDKNSKSNAFLMKIPSNVKSGDTLNVVGDFYSNIYVSYINKSGENFGFGYPLGASSQGRHLRSKAQIVIDKWEGMGGYANGSFNGEIYLTENDVITFKNGQFKIKIRSSGF